MLDDSEIAKREVQRLCDEYELALIANDAERLSEFFWQSEQALRFGATEELYGAEKISEFRQQRKINFTDRTGIRQDIVAFGPGFAVATLEFSAMVEGVPKHGRQTQVWVKFPEQGWRIVSAHVSHRVQPGDTYRQYVGAAAYLQGMNLSASSIPGVADELQRMGRLAQPLMNFPLDETVEPAPIFTP